MKLGYTTSMRRYLFNCFFGSWSRTQTNTPQIVPYQKSKNPGWQLFEGDGNYTPFFFHFQRMFKGSLAYKKGTAHRPGKLHTYLPLSYRHTFICRPGMLTSPSVFAKSAAAINPGGDRSEDWKLLFGPPHSLTPPVNPPCWPPLSFCQPTISKPPVAF